MVNESVDIDDLGVEPFNPFDLPQETSHISETLQNPDQYNKNMTEWIQSAQERGRDGRMDAHALSLMTLGCVTVEDVAKVEQAYCLGLAETAVPLQPIEVLTEPNKSKREAMEEQHRKMIRIVAGQYKAILNTIQEAERTPAKFTSLPQAILESKV